MDKLQICESIKHHSKELVHSPHIDCIGFGASPFACAQQLDFELRPHGRSFATGTGRQTLVLLNLLRKILSSSVTMDFELRPHGRLFATGTGRQTLVLLNLLCKILSSFVRTGRAGGERALLRVRSS